MHLVDEEDGVAAGARQFLLRLLQRLADVLHAAEHGREGNELGVERLRHEARDRCLPRPRGTPQDHRVRLARLEGEPQRLTGAEQVLLADDLVDGLRPQPLRQRCRRLYLEEIIHFSPRTSAPLGGSKRNSFASTFGLRSSAVKRSSVRWPKWSCSSMTCSPEGAKPMRMPSKPASRSRGFAASHSMPSLVPPSESSKAFSTSAEPASSAAGVEPRAR